MEDTSAFVIMDTFISSLIQLLIYGFISIPSYRYSTRRGFNRLTFLLLFLLFFLISETQILADASLIPLILFLIIVPLYSRSPKMVYMRGRPLCRDLPTNAKVKFPHKNDN